MRKSTKAALISGLVFPGLGHVYLRKYLAGLVLLCLAGLPVYLITAATIDAALDVANEIQAGNVAPDSGAITKLVERRSQRAERSASIAEWVLLAVWLVGIVDSWRVGRAQERQEE